MLRDEIEELKGSVENMKKEVKEETLATEMLREIKAQSKRKDIIIIILIGVILAMIIGFFIYENQFEVVADTETTTVDGGENGIATYLENSESGDIIYGEDNQN